MAQSLVEDDLDIIWKIKMVREQWPGTFYYWMSRFGKAECYYPRH